MYFFEKFDIKFEVPLHVSWYVLELLYFSSVYKSSMKSNVAKYQIEMLTYFQNARK